MLTATPELTNALKTGDAVPTKPRVYAEWNHNRYSPITTCDNFGYPESDNGYDLETFPITSITEPLRPVAGIAFAKAGEGVTSQGYSSLIGSGPSSVYRTNLATNPNGEGVNGWSSNNGANWTVSSDTGFFRSGTKSKKSVAVTPGVSTTIMSMYDVGGIASTQPAAPGDIITASVYAAHNASTTCTVTFNLHFLNGAGAQVGIKTTVYNLVPGDQMWRRISATSDAAPALTASVRISVVISRTTGNAIAGDAAWVDDALIEKTSQLLPYFDGSYPQTTDGYGFSWVSAVSNSASTMNHLTKQKRFYTTDSASKYKYWTSPQQSNGSAVMANCSPHIVYSAPVWTNKIHLCVENSWAYPTSWTVQVTTDGTTWTTVFTNPTIRADGTLSLYLQADNSWSSNPYYSNATQLRGVRVNVTGMSLASSYFNLIEMGLRLHNELTDYLIDYDVSNELSDPDFVTPMGIISSNTGSVSLSNFDGRFNNANASSLYYGLIDANVRFTIDLGVDTTAFGGTGFEYVRQATMFSESWSSGSDSVNVSLKDASKFLQEITPLSMLMQNVGIGKIIWRMLDSIGFNSYAYTQKAENAETIVPFYWTNAEKTVWDHIQEICKTTQSAAYFDQYGVFQIKTRDVAFDKTQTNTWTFDYAVNGTKKPDIVDLQATNAYEANKVTVNYKPTMLAEDSQHRPISEIVWEPEGDVVLRSSALYKDMTVGDTTMTIDPKDAAYWPYEGMVNVRGEIVKYVGKQYKYVNFAGGWAYSNVKSTEDKLNVDNNLTKDGEQYRSTFTGTFYVTERGVGESIAEAHDSTIAGWMNNAFYGKGDTAMRAWNGGLKHIPEDGILRLQTNKTFTGNHWYVANRIPSAYNTSNFYFGTRMRFPSAGAGSMRQAGLFFSADSTQKKMYVVDIMTTKAVSPYRKFRNEVAVIRRNGNGTNTYLGKGATVAISDDQWFDVDVQCNGAVISVSINGRVVYNCTDPLTDLVNTSRQGLMARGFTTADFEFYYCASYTGGVPENGLDNSTYMDLRRGGYYSSQFYKDYNYYTSKRTIKVSKKVNRTIKIASAQRLFDEFGMQVHEIRDFDVKFEKPVLYSSLYVSNQDQTVTPSFTGTAFGAKFTIANAARMNAVINGDDSTLGTENVVNQKAMVTGRTIQQQDVKNYEVKDDASIRARGENSMTIESDWIQSEAAAKALGNWIVSMWAKPSDEVEMEIFANPLVQVGDVVAINYSPRNMVASTHRYFVISVKQGWDQGPVTTLALRRANI